MPSISGLVAIFAICMCVSAIFYFLFIIERDRYDSIGAYETLLEREQLVAQDKCRHDGPYHIFSSTRKIVCADCLKEFDFTEHDWKENIRKAD